MQVTQHMKRAVLIAAVAILMSGGTADAQFEKMISSTFDGWNQLADGSYELVFGYINRNSSEVEIPLGPANQVEPMPFDRGQPTNFLPGRQRAAFRIAVPKDFKGKFVWTLIYGGQTQTATASLDQNYSLDVGDPPAPGISGGRDVTVPLSGAAQLSPKVVAPVPEPAPANAAVVARRSTGARINVWWSKYRGPGIVTFGDGTRTQETAPGPTGREVPLGTFRLVCQNPPAADCGSTTARFSEPGTYWLRVVAAERSAANAIMKVVVTK